MRRDARVAAWAERAGSGDADALSRALEELVVPAIDGVFVGVGPGVDPGLARLAALTAGVPADVALQVCAGPDAGHVALQTAALAVLSGYQERVLVGAVALGPGAWPPAGRTDALDWRLSHLDAVACADHRLQAHPVDAAAWFARHGGEPEGDLLVGEATEPAAFAVRLSAAEPGPRIASLAGGGAAPSTAGHAAERAALRVLHHMQIGVDEIDLALIAESLPASRATTATALGLPFARVLDPPSLAPAVRGLAGLSALIEALGEQDGRHGLLLSAGPDGLSRATLLDTAQFA